MWGAGGSAGMNEATAAAALEAFGEAPTVPTVEVLDWLLWVWRAWHRLRWDRRYQIHGVAAPMGVMKIESVPDRIPWTAVNAWAQAHGYSAEERDFLDRMIGEMDEEYLAWWASRRKGR